MKNPLSTACPFLIVLLGSTQAATISSTFTGGANNRSWSSPGNWSPGTVPRNDETDQFVVTIPANNINPILYNLAGDTVLNSLTINDGSIIQNSGADRSLTLLSDLLNNGEFEITRVDQSNELLFEDDDDLLVEINGSGTIRLRQGAGISGGGTGRLMLTHGANHTIEGDGFIGRETLEFLRNDGLITANVPNRILRLSLADSVSNRGTIMSSNGGEIQFTSGTITGSAGAKFQIGDDSSFTLSNATFQNLTIERLDLNDNPDDHTLTIRSTEMQEVVIEPSSTLSGGNSLTINHFLENNGDMLMEQGGGFLDDTTLVIGEGQAGSVILRGSGSMRFETSSEIILDDIGSPTFIHEADHTLFGHGQIRNTVGTMINRGSIIADVNNRIFSIECEDSFVNEGFVRAEAGGNMRFLNGDFSQSPTGRYEIGDDCNISLLGNVGLIGVTMDADDQNNDLSDNILEIRGARLQNTTLNVNSEMNPTSSSILEKLTNNALLEATGGASFNRGIIIIGSPSQTETLITGTGKMTFDTRFHSFEGAEGADHTLINDVDHTIEGPFSATLRITSLINRGILRSNLSNQNITLNDIQLQNEGLLELVNSGRLNLGNTGLLTNQGTVNIGGRFAGDIRQLSGETTLTDADVDLVGDVEVVGGSFSGVGKIFDTLVLGTSESLPEDPAILSPGLSTGQLEVQDGLSFGPHSTAQFEIFSQADFDSILSTTANNEIGLSGTLDTLELTYAGDLQNLPDSPITLIDANVATDFRINNVTNGSRLTTTDGNVSFRVTWPDGICITEGSGLQISEARRTTGETNASVVTSILTAADGIGVEKSARKVRSHGGWSFLSWLLGALFLPGSSNLKFIPKPISPLKKRDKKLVEMVVIFKKNYGSDLSTRHRRFLSFLRPLAAGLSLD